MRDVQLWRPWDTVFWVMYLRGTYRSKGVSCVWQYGLAPGDGVDQAMPNQPKGTR
jgi:hypothetical protein